MEKMRLQKYIALSGYASRRKAEELINRGAVTVNGSVVKDIILVDDSDDIRIGSKVLKIQAKMLYFAFNKPEMVITSMSDQFGRKTVADFFDSIDERVYPVGRLDYDSSGLIFMTNDGEFANFLMHPKNQVIKTYAVSVKGEITEEIKQKLENGVDIGGYITEKAQLDNIINNDDGKCSVDISIKEGKNRQVRKMFDAVGIRVYMLKRISIGPISLEDLKKGRYRSLNQKELSSLGYNK